MALPMHLHLHCYLLCMISCCQCYKLEAAVFPEVHFSLQDLLFRSLELLIIEILHYPVSYKSHKRMV